MPCGQLIAGLLALIALMTLVGHFALDAVCPASAAPGACGTGLYGMTGNGESVTCGWHASSALPSWLAVSLPIVLTFWQTLIRPRALSASFTPPLLPPKLAPIA
jgi:hypothetical protein